MRIADLAEGTEVAVRGSIVFGDDPVRSLGGVECVYWEVGGERCGGARFWLSDDSGRILVDPREASVEARAEYRERIVSLATAELADVESRIRELKFARSTVGGGAASAMYKELKHLRKLATLLCAVRARAKGNVHVGGTLEGQERYIAARSPQFRSAGSEVLRLTDAREMTLAAGDRIEASGVVCLEPIPPELFAGGYRDQPTCLWLRAPAGGELRVRGLGDAAPRALVAAPETAIRTPAKSARRLAVMALAASAVIYALVRLLGP